MFITKNLDYARHGEFWNLIFLDQFLHRVHVLPPKSHVNPLHKLGDQVLEVLPELPRKNRSDRFLKSV
jgi:hypothetical protein